MKPHGEMSEEEFLDSMKAEIAQQDAEWKAIMRQLDRGTRICWVLTGIAVVVSAFFQPWQRTLATLATGTAVFFAAPWTVRWYLARHAQKEGR